MEKNLRNGDEQTTAWICKKCGFQGDTTDGQPSVQGCSSGGSHQWGSEKALGNPSAGQWQCTVCEFFGSNVNTPSDAGCPGPLQNPSLGLHAWQQIPNK